MDLVMDPFVWFFWVPYSPLSNSRKSIWQTSQVMSRKSCLISCSILSFYRHSWKTSLYQPYIPPPSHFLWHLHNFISLNSPFKVYNRFAQARVHPAAHVHPKTFYFPRNGKIKKSLSVAWTFLAAFTSSCWTGFVNFQARPMKPSMDLVLHILPSARLRGLLLKIKAKSTEKLFHLQCCSSVITQKLLLVDSQRQGPECILWSPLTENALGSKKRSQFLWCTSQVHVQLGFCPPHRNASFLTYKKPQCSIFNHIQY